MIRLLRKKLTTEETKQQLNKKIIPQRIQKEKFSGDNIQKRTAGYTAGKNAYQLPTIKLRVIPLGGMEEVGRNCMLFEYEKDIIIIDMGLQFPEEDMPGIDYIIPNVEYLKGKEKNIKGVIITHGHYDHIGGIPHIMGKIGNPTIYTAKLTAGMIKKRQEEFLDASPLRIQLIDEYSRIQLGKFDVEFFRVNHNIPDSFGVVIHTPIGTVVHTGDFKIDHSPVNDMPADINRIAQFGSRNVLALFSDSTDAEHPGYQISEQVIGRDLEKIFENAIGRIVIGTFASLLSRVQQLIWMAEKYGRKVMIYGRSMKTNVEIAHQLGYLKIKPGTLVDEQNYTKIPDNKLMIMCTGAQGERNAALMRIANDDDKYLFVKENDTFVFSSSVVPGNERTVQSLKDTLYKKGAQVMHYKMMDIHAGGHAKQEDLKLMIRLVKPKYFIPIEANHYMLRIHGNLAESVGIPKQNIFISMNGQVLEFFRYRNDTIGRITNQKVNTDYVMVDGLGVGDVSNIVLRDRRMMAEDGMFVVIATISKQTGALIGSPDLISRGFVYMKENKILIEDTRQRVRNILRDKHPESGAFADHLKDKIRRDIGQFLFKKTKRRPMVLPVIIEV
ncbi:MAG: ribonuclease J [bacterium]